MRAPKDARVKSQRENTAFCKSVWEKEDSLKSQFSKTVFLSGKLAKETKRITQFLKRTANSQRAQVYNGNPCILHSSKSTSLNAVPCTWAKDKSHP